MHNINYINNDKKAQKFVEKAMHEYKEDTLETETGKKVKKPSQALAIGFSEAREAGAKVPSRPKEKNKQ